MAADIGNVKNKIRIVVNAIDDYEFALSRPEMREAAGRMRRELQSAADIAEALFNEAQD